MSEEEDRRYKNLSVKIPIELFKEAEEAVERLGYISMNELVRDAIRLLLRQSKK
ncbi:MAG: ribbon-helix-helix domain-containing protein [Nitrososphaerota archaeon]